MIALDALVRTTAILGMAAIAQVMYGRRRSAALRHLLWTLALGAILLAPALATSLPAWSPVEYAEPAGFVPLLGTGSPEPPALDIVGPIATPVQGSLPWMSLLGGMYAAGVIVLLIRLTLQHVRTNRLVQSATPTTDGAWLLLLGECRAALHLRRPVRLLRAGGEVMPAAAGIRRPCILLPATVDGWSEDRRRAVLLHELAHVERHDCLTQTLAAVACAVYWIHPGVWWVAARLRAERELACDDRVLCVGEDPREYAGHLLELAAAALGHRRAPAMAVAMARPHELEGRMVAVLDTARNRETPASRSRLAAVAVLALITVPVAAATLAPPFHVLGADELRRAGREPVFQSTPAGAPSLAFDVASIKRTPDDTAPGSDFAVMAGGRLQARNNPVSNFITNSYRVANYALIGGPGWMREERYDLEARADRERPRAEIMQMLQTLLAERFALRLHRETRELPAYIVTVARGGPRLKRSSDETCVQVDPSKPTPPRPPLAPGERRLPQCGNNLMTTRGVAPNMKWSAVHIDLQALVGSLAIYFRRPVVDRTGLTGFYDIEIELPPLQPAADVSAGADTGISVFTVLQEQLGLRVEEGKGPVDVLVLDNIQRPTAN
jgi:uncharacterized protein (TIGR03435 family)